MSDGRLIPPHGGYRRLRSFQVAQEIYDATVLFCERFIDRKSRTHDQMIQASRSGVQNIAEGSMASATSKKMEIKLTGVAKASLEELLRDYEDYLRQHGLKQWGKDSPEARKIREMYKSDRSDESDTSDIYGIRTASAEVAGNTVICLIHQATYLLRKQLERLEREFLEKGGFTERMYHERKRWRDREKKE
ncbi:MAG: four helix bundle suffix domain-containing protein [Candidatus Hydrogenedens sp.]|nr:four helix bundle suffix domain-containing protein [Candidatus Hydrogenedens sp.]